MDSDARYSIHVSNTLNCMGYNKEIINYRVIKYKERSEGLSGFCPILRMISVGSKGEGLSAPMHSDSDHMVVYKSVSCAAHPNPRDTVFEMDTRDSPPGYTKLKLYTESFHAHVNNSLVHFGHNGLYISSEIFLIYNILPSYSHLSRRSDNVLPTSGGTTMNRNGPATTYIVYVNGIMIKSTNDIVPSFPCTHFSLLDKWKHRRRDHNWPPLELIMNIHNTDIGYLVPVGPKGSDNQHLEWRICFTTIEQKLIQLLHNTQSKVYVLLKMVAKLLIQPTFEDITSYLMKNIVLWMAELVPEEQFREHLLIDRLMQALHYLKYCVKTNCLASYMIPARNLLARKLTYPQRLKLAETLSEIISQGGSILLRCKQFKRFTVCMYKVPQLTFCFAKKRDMIERLFLLYSTIFVSLLKEGLVDNNILRNDQRVCAIDKTLQDIVIPKWRTLAAQGIHRNIIRQYFNHELYYYLS